MSGEVSYHAGRVAEECVARRYREMGCSISAMRWRGPVGEIDLIARDKGTVIFIEVKKSRNHAQAAEALTKRQMARIYASAAGYLAGEPSGQDTDSRFDVALVDAVGRIEILQNAFAA
jgi:putative endonuclease